MSVLLSNPDDYIKAVPYLDAAKIMIESDSSVNESNKVSKMSEAVSLLMEETSPVGRRMHEKLYQAVLDKAHINFDDIPKSAGNIKDYSGYTSMIDTLNVIGELAKKENKKDVLHYVGILNDAIHNIENLSATYNKGFVSKNTYVALEYDTYVYTCVEATSALIYTYVDYIKDPNTQIMVAKINNSKLRADKFYFDQLEKFNRVIAKNGTQYRKMLEEMISGNKSNFIGVDMAVGMAAIAAVAYAIIPVTRALVYQIYKLRSNISDTLALQSKFLEMNETCILNNSNFDKEKKKEIIDKQKKLSQDLRKLSDSIRVKSAKSISDSERELKKDNTGFSIDALRDDVSNSAFELI